VAVLTEGVCYPRPRKGHHKYSGGFNEGVERLLLRKAGLWIPSEIEKQIIKDTDPGEIRHKAKVDWIRKNKMILHPFGGYSEYGIKVDLKTRYERTDIGEVKMPTDVVADAHCLPFKDNTFDCVILDPPFSPEYAKNKWDAKPPKFKVYSNEASRVVKEGGLVIVYHWIAMSSVINCILVYRLLIEGRKFQHGRIVHYHKKDTKQYETNRMEREIKKQNV